MTGQGVGGIFASVASIISLAVTNGKMFCVVCTHVTKWSVLLKRHLVLNHVHVCFFVGPIFEGLSI